MLRYDRVLHAYIDSESGAIIPLEEGELPPNEAQESDQMRADREYAESLVRRDRERLMQYGRENTSNVANPKNASPLSRLPYYGPIIATPSEEQLSRRSPTSSTPPFSDQRSMPGVPQPSSYDTISLEQDYINLHINDSESMPNSNGQQHASWDDWTLARTLQMMEFEIAEEVTDRPTNGDFAEKEVRASSFCRQIKTISFIICLVQVRYLHQNAISCKNTYLRTFCRKMRNYTDCNAHRMYTNWRLCPSRCESHDRTSHNYFGATGGKRHISDCLPKGVVASFLSHISSCRNSSLDFKCFHPIKVFFYFLYNDAFEDSLRSILYMLLTSFT